MGKVYAIYSIEDVVVKDILYSWDECNPRVKGVNAIFKKLSTTYDAMSWFNEQDLHRKIKEKEETIEFKLPKEISDKFHAHLKKTNQGAEYVMVSLVTQYLKDNYAPEREKLVLSIDKDRNEKDTGKKIEVVLPWD